MERRWLLGSKKLLVAFLVTALLILSGVAWLERTSLLVSYCVHRLLVANRESGPRTSRAALTGPRVWVYGRSGKPCLRCGTIIRMRRQGTMGRSTYYCPSCQG